MVTLIEREFTVNVSLERAWQKLARLDQWPTWAPDQTYRGAAARRTRSADIRSYLSREWHESHVSHDRI